VFLYARGRPAEKGEFLQGQASRSVFPPAFSTPLQVQQRTSPWGERFGGDKGNELFALCGFLFLGWDWDTLGLVRFPSVLDKVPIRPQEMPSTVVQSTHVWLRFNKGIRIGQELLKLCPLYSAHRENSRRVHMKRSIFMNRRRGLTIALIVLGVAIVALGAVLVFTGSGAAAGYGGGWAFGRGHMDGYRGLANRGRYLGYGHFGFPWLPILGFVILFVVLAKAGRRHHFFSMHDHGHRHGFGRDENHGADESAIEVLRKEFAEGRISMEDFVARKKVLDEDETAAGKEAAK